MLKYILLLTYFLALQVYSQTPQTWGSQIEGVQMSISISNNSIELGSNNIIQCEMRNFSTNVVCFEGNPRNLVQVFLIDSSTNKVRLTFDPSKNPRSGPTFCLLPNETNRYVVPFVVNKKVPAGKHHLQAEIWCGFAIHPPAKTDAGIKFFKPMSNMLDIYMR